MAVINGIEADQRGEKSPVCLRNAVAQQIALAGHALLKLIEAIEQGGHRAFVNALIGGKPGLVDPIIDLS